MKKHEIKASRLNERVLLQRPVLTQDEIGGSVTVWEDVAWLWACVEMQRGGETFVNQKRQSKQLIKITLRYRSDIRHSMRFIWKDQFLNVVGFQEIGTLRQGLEVLAELDGA